MKTFSVIMTTCIFACVFIFLITCEGGGSTTIGAPVGMFKNSADIGGPKLIGTASYDASTGTYTLSGGGLNVWGSFDQHYYIWNQVKGDFTLTAKVAFEGQGVNNHRKIGIMLRDALTGNSRCASLNVHGDGLINLQYREEVGGITKEVRGPVYGHNYITLEKVGNIIRMRTATDTFPTEITGEIELEFPKTFYLGLFTCSHEADVFETAYCTDVEFKQL
jgi:hypothetical protein